MQYNFRVLRFLALLLFAFAVPGFADAQQVSTQALPSPRVRITQAIDETQLTRLTGNTHPLARPEFDSGAAAPSMMMHRMLLVLTRAPEQDAALQQFLMDLHDTSSPNYHRWLTPQQFGQQFGPADADIQTVTSWLESHGFQVAKVSNGRTVIEFSGTVSQVQETFHTDIHRYVVNGASHWANTKDPEIPQALAQVVAGVSTLHNFVKHPMLASTRQLVHKQRSPSGDVNLVNQQNQVFHAVGPADLATIYNVPDAFTTNQFNGNSITIGVVARSNINLSDLTNFYTTFGVSPTPTTAGSTRALPNVILNGPDPGNLGQNDAVEEVEAVLDASYAGSLALNATVDFVVSETTEATDGVDLSEVFIVDNNLADVMTESFGECESSATAALGMASKNVAQQAAAQGITFSASTGDSGAVCSFTNVNTIDVSFPASLPNVVAVGGTMFIANDSSFWAANNNPATLESALKFIPETVWNETIPGQGQGSGGGGVSTLFAAPPWQLSTGITGLTGTMRQLPDVSLNAAANHDPYVLCIADQGALCGAGDIITVGGTSASTPTFTSIMALVDQSQKGRQGEAGYVLYKLASDENSSLASCNASTGNGPTSSTCVFADVTTGNNVITGEVTAGGTPSSTDFTAATGYDLASGLGSPNATNLINLWSTAAGIRTRATTVTLPSVNPATAAHGSLITFSVNVAPATGSGTPTGNVSLIANVNTAGQTGTSGVVLSSFSLTNGSLTNATTNALPGGSYQIHAHYEGDGTFLPGDSNAVSMNISKENSSTQVQLILQNINTGVTSVVNSLPYGSNSAIRMNVLNSKGQACVGTQVEIATASGCPTGTVTLTANGTQIDGGTFALNSLGYTEDQAEPTSLSPASYALSATYSGDAGYSAGTAGAANISITQATTSTTVVPSANSIASGGSVMLMANITTQSCGNPPTGTVTFLSNGTQIGGPIAVSGSFNQNDLVCGITLATRGFAQATATLSTTLSTLPPAVNLHQHNLWKLPAYFLLAAVSLVAALLYGARRARRTPFAYAGLALVLCLFGWMAACGGGGGGGGGHTDSITAKYSGDVNYSASTAGAVPVTVQ